MLFSITIPKGDRTEEVIAEGADLVIPLSPLTCIIGKNGCGKQNILRLIELIAAKEGLKTTGTGPVILRSDERTDVFRQGKHRGFTFDTTGTFYEQIIDNIRFIQDINGPFAIKDQCYMAAKYGFHISFNMVESELHPKKQWELIDKIKKCQECNPGLQVIMTTYSPYLLDRLNPDQILVMEKTKKGTYIKKLSEHPSANSMLGVLSPGEFWASIGESWVAGEQEPGAIA